MKRRYFLKLVILSTVILASLQNGKCQQIEFYSFGNGYDYEVKTAHEAFKCIANRCFHQLERTRFITEDTHISEDLHLYLDSLRLLQAQGNGYIMTSRAKSYYSATDIAPLTFYGVFKYSVEEEPLFQIRLTLSYQAGGLLTADRIELVKKDAIPAIDDFKYKYEFPGNGSVTNHPLPPPPPIPTPVEELKGMTSYLYSMGRINLCNACQVKSISVDQQGRYWLHEKYDYKHLRQLQNGHYLAKEGNMYGMINDSNEVLVPIVFEEIKANSSRIINVKHNGMHGVYDFEGNLVIPAIYDELSMRVGWVNKKNTRIFIVKKDGKYGAINSTGEEILPMQYDQVKLFWSSYLRLKKDGKFGLVSINGNLILNTVYQEIDFKSVMHLYTVIKEDGEREAIRIIENEGEYKIERFLKIE